MNRILVLPNPVKQPAMKLAIGLVETLQRHEFEIVLENNIAAQLNLPSFGVSDELLWDGIELVLVLGGDGSMLNAARRIYPRQIPILGINLGQLGFLTRIESHKIEAALKAIRTGQYQFEERTMLSAEINGSGYIALNDLVVTANSMARMIRLETWIDEEYFTTYPADGLITATSTGSTAYSLSAGGPILDPRLEAIVVTPICAHSLYARPIILNKEARIRIIVHSNNTDVSLTADGQTEIVLKPGEEICISRAQYITKLLRFNDQGLFEVLKSRLKEGRI